MGDHGNIMALIVLAIVAVVILGGWLAFPTIAHFMQNQDCVAAGHINC
jgi:hypothetical protein